MTKSDAVAKLIADAKTAAIDCDKANEAMMLERAKLPPVLHTAVPAKPMPPPEPEGPPSPAMMMMWIAEYRRRRGEPGSRIRPFTDGAAQYVKSLVREINDKHRLRLTYADAAEDEAREIGVLLKQLKELKPKGVTFAAYLKDKRVDFSRRRADEYIQIAEGKTNVLKKREEKRTSVRKTRKKARALRSAQPTVDSKGKKQRPAVAAPAFEDGEKVPRPDRKSLPVVWKFGIKQIEIRDENDILGVLFNFKSSLFNHRDEWQRAILSDEGRSVVVDALHQCANDVSKIAQVIAGIAEDE